MNQLSSAPYVISLRTLRMKVEIKPAQSKAGWEVTLDTCAVSFHSHEEAEAFVKRLQARLDAPHPLPTSCSEILTELTLPANAS
jgi:hypothetical protein